MKLNILKPSSFFCMESPVKILDDKGNLFYIHPNKENKITFNLPEGKYTTKNFLIEKGFVPYVRFDNKFNYNPVKGFTIKAGNNIHKATINPTQKRIIIDHKIANSKFKPVLTFILGHEIAHLYVGGSTYNLDGSLKFDAESECDKISENYMLSHGWNPTQIKIAKHLTLSGGERRNCTHYHTNRR